MLRVFKKITNIFAVITITANSSAILFAQNISTLNERTAYKDKIEKRLEQKASFIISKLSDSKKVFVDINADINFNQSTIETTDVDPRNSALLSSEQKDGSTKNTYSSKKTTTQIKKDGGSINKLSVTLVVKDLDQNQKTQLEDAIKSSIGFSSIRGDRLNTIKKTQWMANNTPISNKTSSSSLFNVVPTPFIAALISLLCFLTIYLTLKSKRTRSKLNVSSEEQGPKHIDAISEQATLDFAINNPSKTAQAISNILKS